MTSRSSHSVAFRVLRGIIVALLIVVLLPYALAPLYRVLDPV